MDEHMHRIRTLLLGCFTLCATVLMADAQSPSAVAVGRDGIEIKSCMKPSRIHPGTCLFGQSMRAGCYGSCADAVVKSAVLLDFRCRYELAGVLVEVGSGKALEGMPVHFLLAGRVRYTTRSDKDGRFTIMTQSGSQKDCVVRKTLGKMPTEAEAGAIMLLGSLSENFRSAHKRLKFEQVGADRFTGRSIDLGTGSR